MHCHWRVNLQTKCIPPMSFAQAIEHGVVRDIDFLSRGNRLERHHVCITALLGIDLCVGDAGMVDEGDFEI